MSQMILEFQSSDLTKLRDSNILSSKSNNKNLDQLDPGSKMKAQPTYDKLRGGYYTPKSISTFLANWAIRTANDSILEPSCGDGVFVEAAAQRLLTLKARPRQIAKQIVGHEIDRAEASKTELRLGRLARACEIKIHSGDFFGNALKQPISGTYEAVLGNPPFIRYQNFPESQRALAFGIMQSAGLRPNRLTNAWVPFVVVSSLLLKPHGRLAMVLPAELLQVSYAAQLRFFLSEYFSRIKVITFRGLAIEGVQQEVVLLLAERGNIKNSGIDVVELDNPSQLSGHKQEELNTSGLKAVDHTTEKWTQYYLTEGEIELVRNVRSDPRLTTLGDIADTDVGVVTGMNDFFLLTSQEANCSGLESFTRPLVSRSNQMGGIIFSRKEWAENARLGHPVHLLDLPAEDHSKLPRAARAYIAAGEAKKVHVGYKCRVRKRWYVIPSIYVPTGFLLRQIHQFPKLVVNEANATSTDTIHRVRFKNGESPHKVAAAFLNSLTFAFSELLGRSYGGGVLELEPNEADALPLPLLGAYRLDPMGFDSLLRGGQIGKVLDRTDKVLLQDAMGFSTKQISTLRGIWNKLRLRRIQRRRGATTISTT